MQPTHYTRSYAVLKIFRDTMVPFTVARLRDHYGKAWWHDGVKRVLGEDGERELHAAYERRYGKPLATVERRAPEPWEMLDVNRLLQLIDGNWKAFAGVLGHRETTKVWLQEINGFRNVVSHPESGDLKEETATRNIDTIHRILLLVNPDAAAEVAKPVPFARVALRESEYDFEEALAKLEESIERNCGGESEEAVAFKRHKNKLWFFYAEKNLSGDDIDQALKEVRSTAIAALDELANRVTKESFLALARVPSPPDTPEEAHDVIAKLEEEIEKLKRDQQTFRKRATRAEMTASPIDALRRLIARKQNEIDQRLRQINHVREFAVPGAFFRVKRSIPSQTFVEEQRIAVDVELRNLGRSAVEVEYRDAIPPELAVVDGTVGFEGFVFPGTSVHFRYICEAVSPGIPTIACASFVYAGRSESWDQIPDSSASILPARPASLRVSRWMRPEPDGLRLLVRFENDGQRAARVRYAESVRYGAIEPAVMDLQFDGTIAGGDAQTPVNVIIPIHSPWRLTFAPEIEVRYSDRSGEHRVFVLKGEPHRFSETITPGELLCGRARELHVVDEVIRSYAPTAATPPRERLLRIAGAEGTGKSRLVRELAQRARAVPMKTIAADLSRADAGRTLARQITGIECDPNDVEALDSELLAAFPDESAVRRALKRFLSDVLPVENDVRLISVTMAAMLSRIARNHPILMVIENAHEPLQGADLEIIRTILGMAFSGTSPYVLVCITHRGDFENIDLFRKASATDRALQIGHEQQRVIQLEELEPGAIRELVDSLMPFPRVSDPLCAALGKWAAGNPMYIIEALRALIPSAAFVAVVGGEWYSTNHINFGDMLPATARDAILKRLQNQLSERAYELAELLSVIGFQLPFSLADAVAKEEFPAWTTDIEELRSAAILVATADTFAPFEFEHEVKRDVIYEHITDARKLQLEERIANVLFYREHLYRTAQEQLFEAARHAMRAPSEFLRKHAAEVANAAQEYAKRHQFGSALSLYDKLSRTLTDEYPLKASVLLERSRVLQAQGLWQPARETAEAAANLLAKHLRTWPAATRRPLRRQIAKELGRIALHQPSSTVDPLRSLERARNTMESPFHLRRFMPPNDMRWFEDIVEIYLDLAEAYLRKGRLRACRRICRRARALAEKAKKRFGDATQESSIYLKIGEVAWRSGSRQQAFGDAAKWYDLALAAADDDFERERVLIAQAEAAEAAGLFDEAIMKYEQAIEFQTNLGDQQGLVLSYAGLAIILDHEYMVSSARRLTAERAEAYFKRAFEDLAYITDPFKVSRICIALTRFALDSDDIAGIRTYWANARTVLFDQHLIARLDPVGLAEIKQLLHRLTDAFERAGLPEDAGLSSSDQVYLNEIAPSTPSERGFAHLRYGDAQMRLGEWDAATEAYQRAAQERVLRAEAAERLGNLYAVHPPLAPVDGPEEESHDAAETEYERATLLYLRRQDGRRSFDVYEKLLDRLLSDASGAPEVPNTVARILADGGAGFELEQHVAERALHKLLIQERYVEAADVMTHAVHHWIRARFDNLTEDLVSQYVDSSLAFYRKGTLDERACGLHDLINIHFELQQWEAMVSRFTELFDLYAEAGELDELVETLHSVSVFTSGIDDEILVRFVAVAESAGKAASFSGQQRASWLIGLAKIAGKLADRDPAYIDRTMSWLDEAIDIDANPGTTSTAFNDSAVHIIRYTTDYDEALKRLNRAIDLDPDNGVTFANRGGLLIKIGHLQPAGEDLDQAMKLLRDRNEQWKRRLSTQEKYPLTTGEIASYRHHGDALGGIAQSAALHTQFAHRDFVGAAGLLREAMNAYRGVGLHDEAERAQDRLLRLNERALLSARDSDCPACSSLITASDWTCGNCGEKVCTRCRVAVDKGSDECPNCKEDLCVLCGCWIPDGVPECPACQVVPLWISPLHASRRDSETSDG
jgi:tetratricopeptide (TPR) repeat protein